MSTPVDSVLMMRQHQLIRCWECVNNNWIGVSSQSELLFCWCWRILSTYSVVVDTFPAPNRLALTRFEHQIDWRWRIMRTKSAGVDALWEPNGLALTHYENQIGWRWRVLSTKSAVVDAFWAPNQLALTHFEHRIGWRWRILSTLNSWRWQKLEGV